MPKILVYNAQTEAKIDSITRVLTAALKDTGMTVQKTTAATLLADLDDTAVLILPGARAGTAYREQLAGAPIEAIRRKTHDGMHVLGICAGAFVLSREFEYDEYDSASGAFVQTKKMQSELTMAAVRCFGPDLRLYKLQPREEENPWSVYTAADVHFTSGDETLKAALALSKGPSMQILDPENCAPLAVFEKTGDVAVAQFTYGKGGGVLSGPALEVGGQNLMHYIHPRDYTNAAAMETVTALQSASQNWARFLVKVFENLLPQYPQAVAKIAANLGVPAPSAGVTRTRDPGADYRMISPR